MRVAISVVVALFIVYCVDQTFNRGRLSDPAMSMLYDVKRGLGF